MGRRKEPRPPKETDLLVKIRSAIESGEYLDTTHAQDRQSERRITRPEYEYVLKHGWHEARKDQFSEAHQAWNYAIRGRTLDLRELRVIVSFDPAGLLIITVIELEVP